jgi:hypothetical protein
MMNSLQRTKTVLPAWIDSFGFRMGWTYLIHFMEVMANSQTFD